MRNQSPARDRQKNSERKSLAELVTATKDADARPDLDTNSLNATQTLPKVHHFLRKSYTEKRAKHKYFAH